VFVMERKLLETIKRLVKPPNPTDAAARPVVVGWVLGGWSASGRVPLGLVGRRPGR
jgi:hypothetical protein